MGEYHGVAQEKCSLLTDGYVRGLNRKLKLNIPIAINALITKWNFDSIDLDKRSKKILYDMIKKQSDEMKEMYYTGIEFGVQRI